MPAASASASQRRRNILSHGSARLGVMSGSRWPTMPALRSSRKQSRSWCSQLTNHEPIDQNDRDAGIGDTQCLVFLVALGNAQFAELDTALPEYMPDAFVVGVEDGLDPSRGDQHRDADQYDAHQCHSHMHPAFLPVRQPVMRPGIPRASA